MITDIHSHHLYHNHESRIVSLCMNDNGSAPMLNAANISVGIHPWFLSESNFYEQKEWVRRMTETDSRVMAIGECGTDRICSTPIDLQNLAFRAMIELSEEKALPLIIHSVKTIGETISLKKQFNPKQKWIIHGFRGKKETAVQLINHGIYISLGEKFNHETAKYIPTNMLLIETDESKKTIHQIAYSIAQCKNLHGEELIEIIVRNTNSLFFSK